MKLFLVLVCGAFNSLSIFAQSTPAFEVADVHVSTRDANQSVTRSASGDWNIVHNATLVDLIRTAYNIGDRTRIGVDDNQRIVGGPTWLELDRFDVAAKAPPSTARDTLSSMFRTLLAERFQLVVHPDTRPLPGFVLSLGKGKPRLKEADGSGDAGCKPQPDPGNIFSFSCRNMTMQALAEWMPGVVYTLNNPVVDNTGLKGSWDFSLKFGGAGGPGNTLIFDALDELGLKLEPGMIPRQVIVVDSVSRKPTGNAPNVAASLPPPPPARFEVAVIKLSTPGTNRRQRIQPGGRLDLQAFTLRMMINLAWNINNDEMLVGAPKFLDSTLFDVTASAASGGQADSLPIEMDDVRVMLRALLTERFGLSTHVENRPVNAYKLVAAKPTLQKADPASRVGCKNGPGADGKDPRIGAPWLMLVSCQNVTMAQFAEQLPVWANGYINSPVADATGIVGEFDFTLTFTQASMLPGTNRPVPAGAGAADPSTLLSIFDSMPKQLGLKLDTEKRPLPVRVIDHVEEKPTDN